MPIKITPGTRLFSAVCSTEMIAVKAPTGEVDITIGGEPPVLSADDRDGTTPLVEGHDGGTAMGKRYVDETGTLELLCTKAGDGSAAVAGVTLAVKESKPLPASD